MLAFQPYTVNASRLRLSIGCQPAVFRGEYGDDVERWLNTFEQCARQNKWQSEEWPRLAFSYLSDTWQDWYATHADRVSASWRVFRREFGRAVGPANRYELLLETWDRFALRAGESAYAHANRFYRALLGQLAGAARPATLDRYLVAVYRKTRAVIDEVSSPLGREIFCAFVSEDVFRLARCVPARHRPASSWTAIHGHDHKGVGEEALSSQPTRHRPINIHPGLVSTVSLLNAPSPAACPDAESEARERKRAHRISEPPLSPRTALLSPTTSVFLHWAQSSSSDAPVECDTGRPSDMSPSIPSPPPSHCPSHIQRRSSIGAHQRHAERLHELTRDFDDLSRQFNGFRIQSATAAHERSHSDISIHTADSDESYVETARQPTCSPATPPPPSMPSIPACPSGDRAAQPKPTPTRRRAPRRTAPKFFELVARACHWPC